MPDLKTITLLIVISEVICSPIPQTQDGKSQQSIAAYDPQLLNYQLQQLALQQFSASQDQTQQVQQYDTQPARFPAFQQQAVTSQQYSQQPLDTQYLRQSLFQPAYETQFNNAPAIPQSSQGASQQAIQQKQSLLGVAYSSAADASRTSFSGYGIKYSF